MNQKIFRIIFINFIIFFIIFFTADDLIYRYDASRRDWTNPKKYIINNPYVHLLDVDKYGRNTPIDFDFNNKLPVVVFGCSYAYGQNLNDNQTFTYKLSKILKRPVINRAVMAGSFQHMYYQSTKHSFYKRVPDSDEVIYIMIQDHTRRMLVYTFYVNLNTFLLHYSIKNNKLVMDNYKNYLYNFLKSLYLCKLINHKWVEYYIKNDKNADKITDLEVIYFIKTRENLEKHWKHKINFSVVIYGYINNEAL